MQEMPYHCSAYGCRTGYKTEPKQPGVSVHRFPVKNPELLKRWLRSLRRKDFTPTKNSFICSLHFADSDFYQCRTDKMYHRAKNLSENLKHRRLKEEAVPRFFSGMPTYLTMEERPSLSRSVIATTRVRMEQVKQNENRKPKEKTETQQNITEKYTKTNKQHRKESQKEAETEFWDSDKVANCTEIEDRLKNCPEVSNGFSAVRKDQLLALCYIGFDDDDIPLLKGSITIQESMDFTVVCLGKPMPAENFAEIVDGSKIGTMSEVTNLMAHLKSLCTDQFLCWQWNRSG